jgi:rhamnose transport system substrate-binding protein
MNPKRAPAEKNSGAPNLRLKSVRAARFAGGPALKLDSAHAARFAGGPAFGRKIASAALSALMLLSLPGCAPQDGMELPLQGKKIAIVVKSANNQYFEEIAEGFSSVIEEQGGAVYLREPAQATAEEQITIVNELISEKVDCIAIASNSETALGAALERAIGQGIKVLSFDSAVAPTSRALHVNQADASRLARALLDSASDISGGAGQLAIMSTTNQAHNQNTWISEMRALLEAGQYPEMTLVDIVFGEDDYQITYEKTRRMLGDYPGLRAIIAPTAAGLPAVAQCILDSGREDQVKLTGLGMPSQMSAYIGNVCPRMFLWDLREVGHLTAYAAAALVSGAITGEVGDMLPAGDLGVYQITPASQNGSEIVLKSEPVLYDADNIGEVARIG